MLIPQYPGVECDVAAGTYSFSWNYNPNWSRVFPGGEEIQVTGPFNPFS